MALGDLEVKGKIKIVGTAELAGGAKDTTFVTNLNADQVDSADKDTDGALAANSDAKIPSQKAVKTYVDTADALKANDNAVVKLTGDQTIDDVKTFSHNIVGNLTGNIAGGIIETGAGAKTLKPKIIEIGDWNMNANAYVDVNHGMGSDFIKIRQVNVKIRDDNGGSLVPLNVFYQADDLIHGGIRLIDNTKIKLFRKTNGFFHTAFPNDYDATSYNRGWVTVWYEA